MFDLAEKIRLLLRERAYQDWKIAFYKQQNTDLAYETKELIEQAEAMGCGDVEPVKSIKKSGIYKKYIKEDT